MCGICGIATRSPMDEQLIKSCMVELRHRGPDAEGCYLNESRTVALGHTRLSIIDLSTSANQPMRSANGSVEVVFNGEIYNFQKIRKELEESDKGIRFSTTSDTEVILHAYERWGADMIKKLEGMFAIALYDNRVNKVFLFRDRLGKKPLFYYWSNEHFVFASEIKALLKFPGLKNQLEIDMQAVHEFLHLGYIPEPRTIYRAIRKFPAGNVGELSENLSLSVWPYWKLEDQITEDSLSCSDNQIKDKLKELLCQAVEKRLISDVPLGSFLSGGTDSSLVTAIASKHNGSPLKTFSIGFKESAFDEHAFAARVAQHLGTDHHEYVLSELEALGLVETYLHHMDEPFADTSTIPTMLVSKFARKEVTVALTGDGGDELFLGYGTYAWAQRLANPMVKMAQAPLAFVLRNLGSSRYKRVSHLLESVDPDKLRSHLFSQEQYFFSDKELQFDVLRSVVGYQPFRYNDPIATKRLSEPERQAFFDLRYYLKDDLLTKVDRASMYYGLECRSPLLDQDVIEFSLRAPERVKKKGPVSKWILKEILSEYLPEDLVYRPKWGFSIPLSRWLKHEFQYLINENLNQELVRNIGVVDPVYVYNLIQAFFRGNNYLYNRIWILIVLHKWLKENAPPHQAT